MDEIKTAQYRNYIFALQLLKAAEEAGLSPLPIMRFHTLAYLANVLAPVWKLQPFDGKVLKRKGSPFYPTLQKDLDRLVGLGMVEVSKVKHTQDEDGRWRLEGDFCLNHNKVALTLSKINTYNDEYIRYVFLLELSYAMTSLSDAEIDIATNEDASYSDPVVGVGNVLDFGEWRNLNYSANAASKLREIMSKQGPATPGEAIHMYINHIENKLNGNR